VSLPIVPDLGADLLRAIAHVRNTAQPSATPDDTVSVQSVHAALELDLVNQVDPHSAPAGAADYQLARTAALASEPVTSMHYLGEAVQQSPAYVSVALQDPAFHAMHEQVQDLANRIDPTGGVDQTSAAGTYQPPRGVLPAGVVASQAPVVSEQPIVPDLAQVVETGQDPAPKSASAFPLQAPPRPTEGTDAPASPRPPLLTPPPGHTPAPPPQLSPAGPLPARAVSAAIDLSLLQSWDSEPARAAAANEYQLAQTAIVAGDRPAALQHLEQAILAHPSQPAAALADPAFEGIRGQVRDLVARLTLSARMHAEASISEAHAALQSAGTSLTARPLLLARAYLQSAQASFQLGIYTGYVQAAFAAELAQRIAKEKLLRRWGLAAFAPVERMVREAARRLWFRLPVLAILLGWFVAGIAAAVVSLPFAGGAAFRAWLLPIWAMGLVCTVLYGFVRSIRAALKRRT
jgi:tetratricopeptide (TPR) repeat protein